MTKRGKRDSFTITNRSQARPKNPTCHFDDLAPVEQKMLARLANRAEACAEMGSPFELTRALTRQDRIWVQSNGEEHTAVLSLLRKGWIRAVREQRRGGSPVGRYTIPAGYAEQVRQPQSA